MRRVAAFAVDYAVIAAYIAVLTAVGFAARGALGAGEGVPEGAAARAAGHALSFVTLTVPVALYFVLSEASRRQATVGKRALRLRVVTRSGRRLSLRRSLVRTAVKLAPWELAHTAIWHATPRPFVEPPELAGWIMHGAALGLATWYTLRLFSGSGRTPYDRAAHSRVVVVARGVVRRRSREGGEVVDVSNAAE